MEKKTLRVTQIFDGNIIGVFWTNKEEKVRLIGVDPLETENSDTAVTTASEYTADWLEGRRVLVAHFDEERDAEGNVLGYVYLEDGTLFNAKLIAEGYGIATEQPTIDRWTPFFGILQEDAKYNERGMWAEKKESLLP